VLIGLYLSSTFLNPMMPYEIRSFMGYGMIAVCIIEVLFNLIEILTGMRDKIWKEYNEKKMIRSKMEAITKRIKNRQEIIRTLPGEF
jgi:hypothetical protein